VRPKLYLIYRYRSRFVTSLSFRVENEQTSSRCSSLNLLKTHKAQNSSSTKSSILPFLSNLSRIIILFSSDLFREYLHELSIHKRTIITMQNPKFDSSLLHLGKGGRGGREFVLDRSIKVLLLNIYHTTYDTKVSCLPWCILLIELNPCNILVQRCWNNHVLGIYRMCIL
jgi:hypothetical protein